MAEKKIIVPEGMSSAVTHAVFEQCGKCDYHPQIRVALEAALDWLRSQLYGMTKGRESGVNLYRSPGLAESYEDNGYNLAIQDILRIFLAWEEEVPEEIKDLLVPVRNLDEAHAGYGGTVLDHNHDVLKAYRRGQEISLNRQKCGECVASLIAGASFFPCALPKDHYGGHRAEGNCFKHGPYFGKNNAVPECPQWPECAEPPFTAEQILRTNREVLSDDSNL